MEKKEILIEKVEELKLPQRPSNLNIYLGYQDNKGVKIQIWEIAEKLNEVIKVLNNLIDSK